MAAQTSSGMFLSLPNQLKVIIPSKASAAHSEIQSPLTYINHFGKQILNLPKSVKSHYSDHKLQMQSKAQKPAMRRRLFSMSDCEISKFNQLKRDRNFEIPVASKTIYDAI